MEVTTYRGGRGGLVPLEGGLSPTAPNFGRTRTLLGHGLRVRVGCVHSGRGVVRAQVSGWAISRQRASLNQPNRLTRGRTITCARRTES